MKTLIITLISTFFSLNLCAGRGFDFGLQVSNYQYTEPGLMKDSGLLYGIAGSYVMNIAHWGYWGVDLEYMAGVLTYEGSIQSSAGGGAKTPLKADTKDSLLGVRGVFGVSVRGFMPYIGIGHRFLYDRVQHEAGYRREVLYNYIPLGLRYDLSRGRSVLSFVAEYDLFIGGETTSHLEDVSESYPTITHDQEKGRGHRFAISYRRSFGSLSLTFRHYYRYWNIEDSNKIYLADGSGLYYAYLIEPHNKTQMWGWAVMLGF
jgi:hypothetical protein